MEIIGYLASFAMGITLGLLGGGGSILTVPIMVYLFGLLPSLATAHSLFVVGVTALAGFLMAHRQGNIDFKTGFTFAIPSVIGVNVSRGFVLPILPQEIFSGPSFNLTKEILIMSTFAILMTTASLSMIRKKVQNQKLSAPQSEQKIFLAIQGLIVGLIAGFVGAGGGFLIVPALVIWAGLPMRLAVGTSLMVITLQSLLGFAGDYFRGTTFDFHLLATVSIIAVAGIVIGSNFSKKIQEQKLKTSFGWFVLLFGTFIFFEQIRQMKFH